MKNCKNCGGKILFSPSDKGNKCQSCGSVFKIDYEYSFDKKPFEESAKLKVDTLARSLKQIKCNSCGANVMINKEDIQVNCPYCGNESIAQARAKNLMYIDAIVPFAYDKVTALKKFKFALNSKIYANKRIFKNLTEDDVKGAYVNAFVFDFDTVTNYYGTFCYDEIKKDEDGNSHVETKYKSVSGTFNKDFRNMTFEANSNLETKEFLKILPFNYQSAVSFVDDFLHGYMLEYQDKIFDDCVLNAEKVMENKIKQSLLSYHNCDRIVNLNMQIDYPYKRFNYCLLPVYFISKEYKDKNYTVVLNGQSGKLGNIPKDWLRVFLTILGGGLFVIAIVLLILFL